MCLKAIKRCLTLFLPPNHGFGESFHGSGRNRPHEFPDNVAAEALNAALKPPRKLSEPLDQGFGTVRLGHPSLDVAQPCQIGLAWIIPQGQLGVLQFPK